MRTWNFMAQFAAAVEAGLMVEPPPGVAIKRQTIRAHSPFLPAPRVGELRGLWTGLRQRGARKLGVGRITRVTPIQILDGEAPDFVVLLDDIPALIDECDAIARADGFVDIFPMIGWFRRTHGLPFAGYLCTWRPAVIEAGDTVRVSHDSGIESLWRVLQVTSNQVIGRVLRVGGRMVKDGHRGLCGASLAACTLVEGAAHA
jgi:hypothetical protein